MADLPEFDPSCIPDDVLHAKLLDGLINSALERQKAAASEAVEAQKAQIARDKAQLDRLLAEAKEENEADLAAEAAEIAKDREHRSLFHQKTSKWRQLRLTEVETRRSLCKRPPSHS